MKNEIKEAFDQVHAEDNLKQNTKILLQKTIQRQSVKSRRNLWSIPTFASACLSIFLIFIIGFTGYNSYFTSVSFISIDVNPSIELKINRFDKVIEVEAFNEDGKTLSENVSLKYKDYKTALDTLLQSQFMQNYIAKDELVYITVLGKNDEKTETLLKEVSHSPCAGNQNVTCHKGNWEEVNKAHEAGMSFGKYKAFLELQALDDTVSLEEVQEMSMRQIRNKISEVGGKESSCKGDNSNCKAENKGSNHSENTCNGNKKQYGKCKEGH